MERSDTGRPSIPHDFKHRGGCGGAGGTGGGMHPTGGTPWHGIGGGAWVQRREWDSGSDVGAQSGTEAGHDCTQAHLISLTECPQGL